MSPTPPQSLQTAQGLLVNANGLRSPTTPVDPLAANVVNGIILTDGSIVVLSDGSSAVTTT